MQSCLPQKEVVANLLLSNGGAHLLQIPWQAGQVTPWGTRNKAGQPLTSLSLHEILFLIATNNNLRMLCTFIAEHSHRKLSISFQVEMGSVYHFRSLKRPYETNIKHVSFCSPPTSRKEFQIIKEYQCTRTRVKGRTTTQTFFSLSNAGPIYPTLYFFFYLTFKAKFRKYRLKCHCSKTRK